MSSVSQAVKAVKNGKLVAMPTETVYGLAAPIDQTELIEKIFTTKERPHFDPLIIHVSDISQAKELVENWTELAETLARSFWPGALTMILPKNKNKVSDLITAEKETVAIRSPNHPMALEFIANLGVPVAAPSANKFTKVSPTKIEHVKEQFPNDDIFFLDGGPCTIGIESTIISLQENEILLLRPGLISREAIEKVAGIPVKRPIKTTEVVPGSMKDHYMPEFPLVIGPPNVDGKRLEEIKTLLGKERKTLRNLPDNPALAARYLYSIFRKPLPDDTHFCYIEVQSHWRHDDNWEGILNRLIRASRINLIGERSC